MPSIDDYVRYLQRRNYAQSTIEQRLLQGRLWLAFIGDRFADADRHDVERWLDERPLSPRSRRLRLTNLRQLYRWARREGHAEHDPTDLVEPPRVPPARPRPARLADVSMAIELAAAPDARMLALMADAGLRCAEVAALRWRDVDLHAGTALVVGKGGKQRTVGLPRRLHELLAVGGEPDEPVIGRRGSAQWILSGRGVSVRAAKVLHDLGVPATAHQLRHLYACRLLDATDNVEAVRIALGHVSIATTQNYATVSSVRAVALAAQLDH